MIFNQQVHRSTFAERVGSVRDGGLAPRPEPDLDQAHVFGLPLEAGHEVRGHHLFEQPEGQIITQPPQGEHPQEALGKATGHDSIR